MHFQEMYFNSNFFQTKPEGGYTAPDFCKVADAYGIKSVKINTIDDIKQENYFTDGNPVLVEILVNGNTYVYPKLEFGKPNQDQEPLLPREKYDKLMNL